MKVSVTKGWVGSVVKNMCRVILLKMLMNSWISIAWEKIILFQENKETDFKYKNKIKSQSLMNRILIN